MARILLIDHDPTTATSLAAALAESGHEVALEHNGVEGLERALDGCFDLVVTEVLLPLLDGAELISALRALQPHLPVIVWTGGDREFKARDLITLARFQGAVAGLEKSTPREVTLRVLIQWLVSGDSPEGRR